MLAVSLASVSDLESTRETEPVTMLPIWEIDAEDLERKFRGRKREFTDLLDRLVGASVGECTEEFGIVRTNQKVDHPDGSIDTIVEKGWRKSPTPFLRQKSVWQYKSGDWGETTPARFKSLLKKGGALRQHLRSGYALRLCVCDTKPADKVEAREKELRGVLRTLVRGIPARALAQFQVLDGNRIAEWLSQHHGLARRLTLLDRFEAIQDLTLFRTHAETVTQKYVDIQKWADHRARVLQHLDFGLQPDSPVLRLFGPAGAGKSRFLYETVRKREDQLGACLLYTRSGDAALQFANAILNEEPRRVVLVVDECDETTRYNLDRELFGRRSHFRVLAVDNRAVRPSGEARDVWLDRMTDEDLVAVLRANFPDVVVPRLAEIGRFTNGFIRWAVDLCRWPPERFPSDVREYLGSRFAADPAALSILRALSLVTHLDHTGDGQDIAALCAALWPDGSTSWTVFRTDAFRVHEAPGFVHRGDVFLYVTPQAFVKPLFEDAWRLWVQGREREFLSALDRRPGLIDRLAARLDEQPGLEKERAHLGAYFRDQIAALTPQQLMDAVVMRRVCRLIEADPGSLAGPLRHALVQCRLEALQRQTGNSSPHRSRSDPDWGPRRYVVWLAERLAAFQAHFEDAAAILFRLARCETEEGIANNATVIWKQLHRIVNSGTQVPYGDRVQWLRVQLAEAGPEEVKLIIEALEAAFDEHGMRRLGPPLLGGRQVPTEWHPETDKDIVDSLRQVVDLLRVVVSRFPEREGGIRNFLLGQIGHLVYRACGPDVRRALGRLTEEEAARLRVSLTELEERGSLPNDAAAFVKEWLTELSPRTLRARLWTELARSVWQPVETAQLAPLAEELLANPAVVHDLLGRDPPPASGRACALGEALAEADRGAAWLQRITEDALRRGFVPQVHCGYLVAGHRTGIIPPGFATQVCASSSAPQILLQLLVLSGAMREAVEFATAHLRDGTLSPASLQALAWRVESEELDVERVASLLQAVQRSRGPSRTQAALAFSHAWLTRGKAPPDALQDARLRPAAWWLVERWVRNGDEADGYDPLSPFFWARLLAGLFRSEPGKACRLAVEAVLHRKRDIEIDRKLLHLLQNEYAEPFSRELFRRAAEGEPLFFVGHLNDLIRGLPEALVHAGLELHGLPLARALARHLPRPEMKGEEAIVAPLTRFVLERFGADHRVLTEFACGLHSGVWCGSLVKLAESRAELAQALRKDPCPALRRLAERELRCAEGEIRRERIVEEREAFEAG